MKLVISVDLSDNSLLAINIVREFFIPMAFYFVLLIFKKTTLAKLIFKVKLVDEQTGNPISTKAVVIRTASTLLSLITLPFSYLHITVDSRQQAWHDKAAGCLVVAKTKRHHIKRALKHNMHRDKVLILIETGLFIIIIIAAYLNGVKAYYGEELKPEAKELLAKPLYEEDEDYTENGFNFLMGINCLENLEPSEIGYNKVLEKRKLKLSDMEYPQFLSEDDLENKSPYESQEFIDSSIYTHFDLMIPNDEFDFFESKKDLIDSLTIKFDYLLERYDRVDQFPYYRLNYFPVADFEPMFSTIVNIKRLRLANIAFEHKYGNREKAFSDFQKEMELSRFILTNFKSTTPKVIGHVLFNIDLSLLDKMIYDSQDKEIIRMLPDFLDPSYKDFSKAAIHCFIDEINAPNILEKYLQMNHANSSTFFRLYNFILSKFNYQSNSFINISFDNYLIMLSLQNANIKNSSPKFIDTSDKGEFLNLFHPSLVFGSNFGALAPYFHQIDRTNKLIAMYKLKIEILNQNILEDKIQEFLDESYESDYSKYSTEPFLWLSEEKMITFTDGKWNLQDGYNALSIEVHE